MSTHRIEGAVTVWLLFNTDTGEWEIDPLCFDGAELESCYDETALAECDSDDSDNGEHDEPSCAALLATAQATPFPTGRELLGLLRHGQVQADQTLPHKAAATPTAPAPAPRGCVAGKHRPDDDPTPGDRCKDCGHEVTWTGPGPYDWTPTETEP